jgi:hypothetical protein
MEENALRIRTPQRRQALGLHFLPILSSRETHWHLSVLSSGRQIHSRPDSLSAVDLEGNRAATCAAPAVIT